MSETRYTEQDFLAEIEFADKVTAVMLRQAADTEQALNTKFAVWLEQMNPHSQRVPVRDCTCYHCQLVGFLKQEGLSR